MITHFKARILASAITMLVILNSNPSHAQTAAAAPVSTVKADAPTTQLDHISIQVVGSKGPAIFLIPGLSSPRAVWDGVVPDLAKTHRVYLVQVNGFAGDEPRGNL
jgi:pimeloyl-ACP methyl ester carboxylesterase